MVNTVGSSVQRLLERAATATPVPVDSSGHETPEQARARLHAADAGRVRAWEAMRPAKYRNAAIADLDPHEQHRDAVRDWLDSDSPTLVLVGKYGAGKSHAAYAVANAAYERGVRVAGWAMVTLFANLRPSESDPLRPEVTMERATTWPLAVFDDLGQENVTEWVAEQWFRIIDARTSAGLRQIITLNIGSQELAGRYGSAVLDRIEDDSVILAFDGVSRRRPRF